ncbi:uncharacterized protein LOC135219371 isoform X2 [Macrobrachium nipponense]|uniref:uncharacterized protein LOC135219371 isoform X2 n=1 Tax=Macrobrachium nipponense TaxID=159736 RepID=UPI0030C7BA01
MAATHPLDDPHDTGQVLYSSLLVLGLDAVSLEHSLRTPVNQKIFVRMNKKLGEEILHFLFTCIDQEKASKVFRDCWPLIDKKQEYQFHKATFEWYKSLQQEYGQPLPAVVAKTFLSPGGPKFTSALMTLSTIALHASLNKRVSEHTLIHFPTLSRNPNQNHSKLKLLQVSKRFYLQEFIAKQRTRQSFLSKLQERARSLVERYNALCSEDEMKKQELEQTLQKCERLSQQQKDSFMKSPLSEFQEEIMADISKLNGEAGDLWERVSTFHKIESSSWKVLAPLLDGTMSLSHVDGSLYTPTVPEIVFKDYAVDINKVGLQGLYTDGKLNLLSLVQYSTFALRSILKVVQATHSQSRPESAQELKVLTGRAASMSESMSDLSNKLNTLLPSLIESVSTLRKCTSFSESFDNLELEGKLQLCPPTPPLSLVNTPVNTPVSAHKSKKLLPLHLTPVLGLLGNKRRTVHCMNGITPTRLLSSINITRAAKRSPKADVSFSSSTHLDDSVIIDARKDAKKLEEEAGLTLEMVTVDCRGHYKLKQDQKNLYKLEQTNLQPKGNRGVRSAASRPSQIPKYGIKAANMVSKESVMQRGDKSAEEVCKKISCNEPDTTYSPSIKETSTTISESKLAEELLTEQIADMLANDEYDDSGTAELLTTLSSGNNTVIEASTGDSGCVEGTIDSETLLDAIEKIDITPKSKHKKNRARSSLHRSVGSVKSHTLANSSVLSPLAREDKQSPVKSDYTPKTDTQFTRLIDYTPCIRNGGHLSVAVGLSCEDPFKTPMPLQQLGGHKVALYSSQKSERGFPVLSSTESKSPTNDDLIVRMALLTQSPARDNPTPLASKILSKFEDVNFGKGKNTLKSVAGDGYSSTVEELRHQSKSSLNNLMKQVQQVKEEYPAKVEKMKQRRKTECGFNSKFLTLVKNIKNGKDSIQTTELKESYNSGGQNCENTDEGRKPELLMNSRDSFHSTVARLEALLDDDDDDDDDTFTGNLGKITLSTEDTEKFMDCEEFEKTLLQTPGQQSSYLPRNSIFDTLTESILAGEVCSSLLTNEDVQDEIRRESISSRRQSLISLGRMSIGSNKGLSEALSVFQHRMSTGCAGILDESDSCLLSISVDDFEDF